MSLKYGILWLLWLAGFLAIELTAATNKPHGDTLSEWAWHIISHPVVYFPFAGFLIWLGVHFLSKGKIGAW